jgi:hypothetical protein
MRDPEVFLAYAPRGPGLRVALFYLASDRDVCGWFTGLRDDGSLASCYFLLEEFYSSKPTRYETVHTPDLHSAWSLDEARRHDLARVQAAFAREWLVYRDDPAAARELQAYDEAELGAGELLVRFDHLAKFDTTQPNWTHFSPGFQRAVLNSLSKRWPLDFHPHAD